MHFQGNESSIWNLNVEQLEGTTCEKYNNKKDSVRCERDSPHNFLIKMND